MMESIQRSALYMPANNERAVKKGPSLDADVIILDLEDSVAPALKSDARTAARLAITSLDYGHRQRVVRTNGVDSPWFSADIEMVLQARPDAILLPKIEHAGTLLQVQQQVDAQAPDSSIALWAMLETTTAVVNAVAIANAREQCPRLTTFCIGNNDLAQDAGMRIQSDRTLLIPWLMQLVLAAKSRQLHILDGVFNDFANLDGFTRECEEGAAMGMSGKTLIHPSQISIANTAFAPTQEDIARANAIVNAFALAENKQAGVLQINGEMVERLHLTMAMRTLALAKHIKVQ